MPAADDRPHATMTDAELAPLADWLGRHIDRLQAEHAAIRAELLARQQPTPMSVAEACVQGGTLSYRDDRTPMAHVGSVGDPYADAARHYAIGMALKIGVAAAVLSAVACGLLILMA